MRFILSGILLLSVLYVYADAKQLSPYKNNEKHIAKEVDVNNVPVDPACKFQTVWDNVKFNGASRSEIPNTPLKHITVVKFNYSGAWIAWSDENGYHESSKENFVAWKNFPDKIKEYYEKIYMPKWKPFKAKKPFSLRTAQIDPKAKKYQKKTGVFIQKRAVSGVLCRALMNNVFIPYSELPVEIRTLCGFYENEAYIPAMPVLEKKISNYNDNILFVPSNCLKTARRFKEGNQVRVWLEADKPGKFKYIFIQKYRGRMVPNHKSDLHIFKDSVDGRTCIKCKLSDYMNNKFFNFMFDRQSRTPCNVPHYEYALIKKGTQKIGKITVNSYQYLPDYDKKYPPDSIRLLGKLKVPKKTEKNPSATSGGKGNAEGEGGIPGEIPEEEITE